MLHPNKPECPIYLNICLEKVHSNVHKSPVRARMRMPSYEITGNIYCTNGQRTPQLLEEELMFFPLTDARIPALRHLPGEQGKGHISNLHCSLLAIFPYLFIGVQIAVSSSLLLVYHSGINIIQFTKIPAPLAVWRVLRCFR